MNCNFPTIIMTISGPGTLGGYSQSDGPVELCPTAYRKGNDSSTTISPDTSERWDWYNGGAMVVLYAGVSTQQSWGHIRSDGNGDFRLGSFDPTVSGSLQDRLFTVYDLGNGTTVTLERGSGFGNDPDPEQCPSINVKERWFIYNENGTLQPGTHNNQSNAVERLMNELTQNGNEGWTAKGKVSIEKN
jgi:hypothetical protein